MAPFCFWFYGLLILFGATPNFQLRLAHSHWKQRCTLLFELIYQHFDGRGTAEELISHDVINYVAVEVTEDFKEVFEAMQAKYPSMDLNSSVHGYLIHVQNLIKEGTDFEYPNEILYLAETMIAGKFKGFMN